MNTLRLLLAALCLLCVKCETLTQPASVTVQPGQRLSISCQVSYSATGYYTAWIRQPAGKGLEWIGMKATASYYKDSLKNKFSIDVDSSSNTVTLNGQNMQPEDTAVYYCARVYYYSGYGSGYNAFDYWGKGTMVTVTSAVSKAPTVFPVMPCSSGVGDTVTLACLATDFSPSALSFTWTKDGTALNDAIQYPSVLQNGMYSGVSQISVKRQDWNQRNTFKCKVDHAAGNQEVNFVKPEPQVMSPNITLYPTWESDLPDSQVRLTCKLSGFYPDSLTVSWTKDSQPLRTAPTQRKLQSTGTPKTFTLSSEIEPDMRDWQNGAIFMCTSHHQTTKYQKTISICKLILSTPPAVRLEIPSFQTVMTANSQITATCIVHSIIGASLRWLLDGNHPSASQVHEASNTTHINSSLTVSSSKWRQMKVLSCKAEHRCLHSTEKTVTISGPPVTRPQVTIRRSFPDFLKGDCAVLECEITELSSSDLYVTFQSNGVDISTKEFVHLGEGSGLLSIRKTFSVPRNYWNKDRRFTCKVSQGFSNSTTSSPTGNIFVDPSLKLLLAPREEPAAQMLSCTAWGFNPHVQWLSGSQKISSESNKSISMKADGVVVVTSQLQVSQTEWKTGKVFTCEVSDKYLNKNTREKVSVCSVTPPIFKIVGVHIQGPSLEQLQNKEHILTVTCLLVGPNLDNFIVTWKLDENIQSGDVHTDAPVQHSNGTQTMQSFFSVSAQDWHAFKQVSCEAKHICSNNSYKGYTIKSRELHPPTVRVTQLTLPELSTRDTVTLICLISGFYPPDIIFYWEKNGIKIPSSSPTNGPLWKDKDSITYLTSSRLNISYISEDESNYSCVVRHESSEKPYRSTIKDVFASVIPTQPSAMLLRGDNELVCLVSGFSPAPINISWFLDNSTELIDYNTSKAHKGPDGKFCIQSHLRLSPTDILPGAVHTCRVTHATVTLNINVTQRETLDDCSIFDFIVHKDLNQDIDVDSWYIACIFLVLFLISTVFSVCAILAKTK